jgi:hypothetical protein
MLAQQKQNEVNDLRSKFIESTDKGLSDIITKADEDAKQRQQAVNTLNTFLSRGASGNLQGNIDDLEYGGKKGIAGIKDLFNNLDKYGVDLSDELMDVNEIAGSNLPNVKGVGTPEEQDNFGKIFGGKMFIDPSQQGLNIFQALQQRIGQGNTNVQGKLSESDANRAAALARFMDTAKVNRTRQENLDTIKNLSKTNQDAFQGEQKGFFKDAENTRTGAIRSDRF